MRIVILILVCAAAVTSPARGAAQTVAIDTGRGPGICAHDANRRRFDFWVGEWDVSPKGGAPVGTSSIQVFAGGCGILENWTGAQGGTGKSINTYDPATRQWQQYWVGQGGDVTHFSESTWEGKSLAFLAHKLAVGATPAYLRRLTFTPLDDGSVRQHSERSIDGGKSWVDEYDLYYRRTKT